MFWWYFEEILEMWGNFVDISKRTWNLQELGISRDIWGKFWGSFEEVIKKYSGTYCTCTFVKSFRDILKMFLIVFGGVFKEFWGNCRKTIENFWIVVSQRKKINFYHQEPSYLNRRGPNPLYPLLLCSEISLFWRTSCAIDFIFKFFQLVRPTRGFFSAHAEKVSSPRFRFHCLLGSSTETVAFQVYEILKIDFEFLQFFWLGSKI